MNWVKLRNKIPHQVKIRKSIYEVVWIGQFKDGQTLGETRPTEKQIVLLNNMTPKLTFSTFMHEVLHAISFETEAKLTENQVLEIEKTVPDLIKLFETVLK